jgi:hypothetical protein
MSNMLFTVLNKAGVPTEKLGDSTGPIQRKRLIVVFTQTLTFGASAESGVRLLRETGH